MLGFSVDVTKIFLFHIVKMVNPNSFLEEGDCNTSPIQSLGGHDASFNHGDSQDESDQGGKFQRFSAKESDNDDYKEVEATYPNISLSHAPPSHSGVRIGSGDSA